MPRIVIKGFGSKTSEVVEKVTSVMRTMSQENQEETVLDINRGSEVQDLDGNPKPFIEVHCTSEENTRLIATKLSEQEFEVEAQLLVAFYIERESV